MKKSFEEQLVAEEMASVLVSGIVEAIRSHSGSTVSDAAGELGFYDGEEYILPWDMADPRAAGEMIAEELMKRPEIRQALSGVGALLVKRLKSM